MFVCSKGKQEYVQLLWHMLDPYSQLFPSTDWDWRLNSTFPDAVPRAVNKTLLAALGCAHPLDEAPPMQLACPVMCLDDCPKVCMGSRPAAGDAGVCGGKRACGGRKGGQQEEASGVGRSVCVCVCVGVSESERESKGLASGASGGGELEFR